MTVIGFGYLLHRSGMPKKIISQVISYLSHGRRIKNVNRTDLFPLGVACDALAVGIGATLFHRYSDGSERPIANISKTRTASQRNYSQIKKEALAIIYALKKFFQYLYGRKFIQVTDH